MVYNFEESVLDIGDTSFDQNEMIRHFMSIFKGITPVSPYTIQFGVDFFRLRIDFKNFNWTCSKMLIFLFPHISHAYNNIGFIVFSNISI